MAKKVGILSKIGVLVALLLLCALFIKPRAWSWTDAFNGTYINAYNLSVKNWSYVATYGATPFTNAKTTYLLVNLSFTGDPREISVIGYSNTGQDLGLVPYYYVSTTSNSVILLIANKTDGNTQWNNLTVFYNPIVYLGNLGNLQQGSGACSYCGTTYQYNGITISEIAPNYFQNAKITPTYSNGSIARFNFTFNSTARLYFPNPNIQVVSPAFVVVANHSLANQKFNISWFPDNSHGYQISNTASNRYILTSYGTIGSSIVSNAPAKSQNANFIFNSILPTDNLGYEGYFSIQPNQIISEGLIANESATGLNRVWGSIFNATTVKAAGLDHLLFNNPYQFGVNISTSSPTSLIVMPAFTRNALISNVITNNNPNSNPFNTTLKGWYYNFLYRQEIYNISWTYNYTTSAYPGSAGIPITNTIHFGANTVPYLMLNITAYKELGPSCQYVYFRDYNNATKTDYGAVNFSVFKCNPNNGTATFILQNITTLGYVYNSVFIYFNSQLNNTPNFALSNVINGFRFQTAGNYIQNTIISTNAPFLFNMTAPLNLQSNIILATNHGTILFGYNGVDYLCPTVSSDSCYPGSPQVTTFNLSTSGLIADLALAIGGIPHYSQANPPYAIITPYLWGETYLGGGFPNQYEALWNTTGSRNYQLGGVYPTSQLFANLFGIKITYKKLYANVTCLGTNTYNCGPVQTRESFTNPVTNRSNANPIISLPGSANRLNLANTTTINFGSGSLATPTILFANIEFPKYILLIVALIVILAGGLMLGKTSNSHLPFILMIIGIWIMGLWQIPILIVAVIVTSLYILYVWTK